MNKEYFERFFYYDETSPSCLRWKVWNGQTGKKNARYPGDIAGYFNKSQSGDYVRYKVGIEYKEHMVHKVVLLLHGISVPTDMEINHINCNPLDNKLSNLEVCTRHENGVRKNMHVHGVLSKSNTSGVLGVRETIVVRESGRIDLYAHAFCKIHGKMTQRKFNYAKYGKEQAWELALEFRKNNSGVENGIR